MHIRVVLSKKRDRNGEHGFIAVDKSVNSIDLIGVDTQSRLSRSSIYCHSSPFEWHPAVFFVASVSNSSSGNVLDLRRHPESSFVIFKAKL